VVPAAAGVAFSVITQPGGKSDVPAWQVGTLAGLFGTAVAWGPSLGYYEGGLPLYATLAGVAKSSALVGAVYLDRHSGAELPLFTLLAVGGTAAWDLFDIITIRKRVRTFHEEPAGFSFTPLASLLPDGAMLGATGSF
jgi:hypothetical protein